MTKAKYLLMAIILIAMMLLIPNVSNAAIEYTKVIPGNDGSINLNFTGLQLDLSKQYSFALVTNGATPENWHKITEYTTTTATVSLISTVSDIVDVLEVTNTGYLYIRDDSTNTNIVDNMEVDLTLPYLNAVNYESGRWMTINKIYSSYSGGVLSKTVYNKIEKITDRTIIEKYLEIKNSDSSITQLEEYLPTCPTTGYDQSGYFHMEDYNDGLYVVWVKYTAENCKDIYGAIIYDGLPEATSIGEYLGGLDLIGPVVESIAVTSPASGTYGTSQIVKITVKFDENITGTTVPELKIQFGESAERTITNGVINKNTIVYTYNIAEDDKGQLAVTGYSGGTITDQAGNPATITSKLVTGFAIIANEDGAIVDNNPSTQEPEDNNNNNNTGNSNNSGQDTTVAPGKLPYAGSGTAIIFAIVIVLVSAIIAYKKYNKLSDIK